jgi:hypothetical protein
MIAQETQKAQRPIHYFLSNTMSQIMGINPKLVFDCFRAFEITSQAITSWIRCAGRGLISLKKNSLHKFF